MREKRKFSWRKEEPTGKYRSDQVVSLRYGGEIVAYAQGNGDHWFWYSMTEGLRVNTAHNPRPLAEVKEEAKQVCRAAISDKES